MTFYDNNLLAIFVSMVIFGESMKNFYLGYNTFSLRERLLLGDIIISEQDGKEDQRLFCFQLSINYLTAFLYLSTYYFSSRKMHFKRFEQLSKFLLVLDPDEYAKRFLVPKEFAIKFSKHLDKQVQLTWILITSYETLTLSFYLTSAVQAISLGIAPKQILICTCSVILGSLGFSFFYTIAIEAYTFYVNFIKLMNAQTRRLTD